MLSFKDFWVLIKEAAARFNVVIALQGGVLFRLLLRNSNQVSDDITSVSLFDITPFTSDIDLIHSGKPSQSAALTQWLVERGLYQ